MQVSSLTRVDKVGKLLGLFKAQSSLRATVDITLIDVEDFLAGAGQSTSSHMLRQSEPITHVGLRRRRDETYSASKDC